MRPPVTRSCLIVLACATAALTLGACASQAIRETPTITPLSQYTLQVEPDLDRIALAVRDGGLSDNQRGALRALADRFRAEGAGTLIVQGPSGADPVAGQQAWAVKNALQAFGVPEGALRVEAYAAPEPRAPVLAGFETLRAAIPDCSRAQGDLSSRSSNMPSRGLGCAITANLAAQIANPRDIVRPRDMAPAEMGRAAVVFANYRKGDRTAAPREELVDARLARAVD